MSHKDERRLQPRARQHPLKIVCAVIHILRKGARVTETEAGSIPRADRAPFGQPGLKRAPGEGLITATRSQDNNRTASANTTYVELSSARRTDERPGAGIGIKRDISAAVLRERGGTDQPACRKGESGTNRRSQ
ncbi:hypothetical protein SmB9_18420 [Sphingosinicella microcystinivorans]|uniref:Uncharacterized protein n=1 Tax=Sphingosinicella microcystinivorans TaxID=335406 RepID=A0AAD1G0Z6_SPHMI|nr:hypothetical protein SmB9_18420 [Sphingosinicella microcystinivorans]